MVHIVKSTERDLKPIEFPGATVRASDAVVWEDKNLSAGFTEYTAPSRLEWTFTYNEVFYMLEGTLEIHVAGRDEPIRFEPGDLGCIEKGTETTIVVPQRAYFVHVTQPAWQEAAG